MTEDSLLPFDLPAVQRKKVTADFAGGSISSDGGLALLRGRNAGSTFPRRWRAASGSGATRRGRCTRCRAMLRFRMFAIACGYEDADDCDDLRADPLFKLAVGRAPESGRDPCSQPTMSRLENAPSRTEAGRLTAALVDIFCRSFASPPPAITLDIDDTCDRVHGHQQLSLSTPLRHPLLPACARLHAESESRWRFSCARQDAVGRRGPHPSQAPDPPHPPPPLTAHPADLPGDSHYRPPRGDGLVRGQRRRLHPRPSRQCRAARPRLRRRRRLLKVRHAAAGADRMRGFAAFDCAARSWRRKTPRGRPAGGNDPRFRRARHRHLRARRRAPPPPRGGLLRARTRRKTRSSGIASSAPPTAPPAKARSPTGSGWCARLRDAVPRRVPLGLVRVRHPPPETSQDRRPGRSRRPRASASTSPRPVPTPPCSACWRGASPPRDPDRRGDVPRQPETLQPPTLKPKTSDTQHRKGADAAPCTLKIRR